MGKKNALFLVSQQSALLIPERVPPPPPPACAAGVAGLPQIKVAFSISYYRVTKLLIY